MPIYQFRERVLKFKDEATLTFPSDAKISAKLEPLPPFGGEKGVTRNFSKDVKMMMAKASPSTGRFFFEMDEPLFPRLSARRVAGTEVFSINGNVVSVESRVQSLNDVENLLDTLCYIFPAVLNLELPDSPYTLYAWGHIGGAKFQLHYSAEQIIASAKCTSKELQEQFIVKSWEQTSLVRQSLRMTMSLHYFRMACRLINAGQIAGQNRFDFMAEAILNLAKSLQSLCGESRDDVRGVLKQLGVSNQEAEALYLPVLFLRSSFDVAHVSLTQYNREQLNTLHKYADLAETAFGRLLKKALERFERGEFKPKSSNNKGIRAEEVKFIKTLGDNLRPFLEAASKGFINNDGAFNVSPLSTRPEPPVS